MPRKFVYDYYDVFVPRDAIPDDADCEFENQGYVFNMAYNIAYERTRLYAMPCTWTFKLIDDPDSADFHVRVCRKRHPHKRPHFHMLVGMPGYMPDTNYTCRSRYRAEGLALSEARNFRSAWDTELDCSTYIVTGNMRDGYDVCIREVQPPEVWMTIRVTQCFEEDCLKELEEQGE